jgi:uncharacterized protein (TIGR03083 family)
MEISEHIDVIRREGDLLAAAAAAAGPDTPVPACPEWRVRDLVRHCGAVHRWATEIVRTARATPPEGSLDSVVEVWPADDVLADWFREGCAELAAALEQAPADLECFTFMSAPSALAFWARRQAHETAIHRVDAESPMGTITPVTPEVAADGIDEVLIGFVGRRGGRLRADPPVSLGFEPTDADGAWRVEMGPDGSRVVREPGAAGTTVRGPASDLFLLVWNRRDDEGLEVTGDRRALDLWRSTVRI